MTQEQKDILLQGNDILIAQISSSIAQEADDVKKTGLRAYLKDAIEAGEELKKVEDEAK